jgi:3-oxoacyl-[acyl-carrier-protein] synthase III
VYSPLAEARHETSGPSEREGESSKVSSGSDNKPGQGSFGLLGVGSAYPERIMTNHDLEKMVDTSDEWIHTRTGIRERRVADEKTATSDLASLAGKRAIESAGLKPEDIDLIIVATVTPDHPLPAVACLVMEQLGIPNCMAFDISAACTGWIYAMTCAHGLWKNGMVHNALVIGADCLTKSTNFKDRTTCILFGDAAGAVVMGDVGEGRGVLSEYCSCDGRMYRNILIPGGGSRKPLSQEVLDNDEQYIHVNGNDVFKFAVRVLPEALNEVLTRANLQPSDLDWVIPHQANLRIIEGAAKRFDIPRERFILNIDRFGNTSAASVPVALDEAVHDGRVKRGDLLGLVAFGGGLTWGASIIRY